MNFFVNILLYIYPWGNNPIQNILLGYTPWDTEREYTVSVILLFYLQYQANILSLTRKLNDINNIINFKDILKNRINYRTKYT